MPTWQNDCNANLEPMMVTAARYSFPDMNLTRCSGGFAGLCLSFLVATMQMAPSVAASADGSPTGGKASSCESSCTLVWFKHRPPVGGEPKDFNLIMILCCAGMCYYVLCPIY